MRERFFFSGDGSVRRHDRRLRRVGLWRVVFCADDGRTAADAQQACFLPRHLAGYLEARRGDPRPRRWRAAGGVCGPRGRAAAAGIGPGGGGLGYWRGGRRSRRTPSMRASCCPSLESLGRFSSRISMRARRLSRAWMELSTVIRSPLEPGDTKTRKTMRSMARRKTSQTPGR